MTALKNIEKLETTGLWRAHSDAQRVEVFVSVGDNSLVISDINNTALSHWSLPALRRLNPLETPALYAPGRTATEELEIEDPTMIAALDQVMEAVDRARPHPGRLRWMTLAVVTATIGFLGVFWFPNALRDHTLRVLPDAKRTLIGRAMLAEVTRLTGMPCHSSRSDQALGQLTDRVLPNTGVSLVVLRQAPQPAMHFPGGIITLSASLIEDRDTPEIAAGYALAEFLRAQNKDPLQDYLDHAGFQATFRLLTTGEVREDSLRAFTQSLFVQDPSPLNQNKLLEWFAQVRVSSAPYGWALDPTGETTLTLIEADPFASGIAPQIMDDSDWLTLQNICQA